MKFHWNRTCVAALCLAAALATALAAADETVFGDRVEVELVVVDVVVTDKSGRAVTDLSQADFELFHDGSPVAISQFTAAAGYGPVDSTGRGTAPTAPTAEPKKIILFLDNLHLKPSSRRRTMHALSDSLKGHLAPEDEVMIVGYGGITEVLLPMTTDRGALRKVLREEADSGARSLLINYDEGRILQIIENRHAEETLTSGVVGGDPCVDLGAIAHAHASQVHGRVLSTVSELNRFVNSLAGYDGRKVLLHVSDGIPLVSGAEAYRFASELCDGTGAINGLQNAVDTATFGVGQGTRWDPSKTAATLQEFNTIDEWSRLAGHANTYQVSFYMYQAHTNTLRAGSVDSARTTFNTESEGRRNKQDALYLLADETGGRALLDADDIELALEQITEDAGAVYQLAYQPPTSGDGRQHRIKVEVGRPGTQVRHRKSYRSKSPDERIADRVISKLVHSEADQRTTNPLAVRLQVAERRPERGLTQVKMRVRVPFEALVLLPDGEITRGLFTVFVATQSDNGRQSAVGQKTVPLRLPASGGEAEYVYTVEVPIWGEGGRVAVAVQDQLGGEVSYLSERVREPKS